MSARHPLQPSGGRNDLTRGLLLGGAFALALFIAMALAQMMGEVEVPDSSIEETLVSFAPPEIEEIEDEPLPELEAEPPQLSLAQLDIALNPGTGGSLAGDFATFSRAGVPRHSCGANARRRLRCRIPASFPVRPAHVEGDICDSGVGDPTCS